MKCSSCGCEITKPAEEAFVAVQDNEPLDATKFHEGCLLRERLIQMAYVMKDEVFASQIRKFVIVIDVQSDPENPETDYRLRSHAADRTLLVTEGAWGGGYSAEAKHQRKDATPTTADLFEQPKSSGWVLKNHLNAYAVIYRNIGMSHDDRRWTMDIAQATRFDSMAEAEKYNAQNRDMLCYPCEAVEVK